MVSRSGRSIFDRHEVSVDKAMPGVTPLAAVVGAEEPGAAAESPVELAKESLQPVVQILAFALPA